MFILICYFGTMWIVDKISTFVDDILHIWNYEATFQPFCIVFYVMELAIFGQIIINYYETNKTE